jgi:hypothetical protein
VFIFCVAKDICDSNTTARNEVFNGLLRAKNGYDLSQFEDNWPMHVADSDNNLPFPGLLHWKNLTGKHR